MFLFKIGTILHIITVSIFDQTSAVLISIRDIFQKYLNILTNPKPLKIILHC